MAMLFLPNLKDKRWRRLEKLAARMQVTDTLRRLVLGGWGSVPGGGSLSPAGAPDAAGGGPQLGGMLPPSPSTQDRAEARSAGQIEDFVQPVDAGQVCMQGGALHIAAPLTAASDDHCVWSKCFSQDRSLIGASELPVGTRFGLEAAMMRGDDGDFEESGAQVTPPMLETETVKAGSAGQGALATTLRAPSSSSGSIVFGATGLDPTAIGVAPETRPGSVERGEDDSDAISPQQEVLSEANGSLTFPSPSSSSLKGLEVAYYLPQCTWTEPSSMVDRPPILLAESYSCGLLEAGSADLGQQRRSGADSVGGLLKGGSRSAAGGSGSEEPGPLGSTGDSGGSGEGSRHVAARGGMERVQSCWRRHWVVWYAVNGGCAAFLVLVLLVQPVYIYLSVLPRLDCDAA